MMLRMVLLSTFVLNLSACSVLPSLDDVLPDKRTEYKKSESLPDLEIPPDLTADSINDSMAIPNEQSGAFSQYKSKQTQRSFGSAETQAVPAGLSNEQIISVKGSALELWPKLRRFFSDKGFQLDLDDAELGVMETDWSQAQTEGSYTYRYKYKVFSEQGESPGETLLYISNLRQELVVTSDGSEEWQQREKNVEAEKQVAGELDLVLNGPGAGKAAVHAEPQVPGSQIPSAADGRKRAEIIPAEDGRLILAMPEEFTAAWRATELALRKAGFAINAKDHGKGLYSIMYYDRSGSEEKKGWLSKLAFWKDEEPQGRPYQISLTGVGDKTEVIVLNDKGDWESNNDADHILSAIQNQYNVQ